MKSFESILWGFLSKKKRRLLKEILGPLEGRQLDRLMSGSLELPEYFIKSKSIFIHIPKTAGTTVWDSCFNARPAWHTPYDWYHRIAPQQCRDYFTFAFVRNPWDRCVSAFHYLLGEGAPRRDSEWHEFIKEFSGFESFVTDWLSPENANKHLIFTPQYRFITNKFGVIDLDYIGRFESFSADMKKVLDRVKGSSKEIESIPVKNASARGDYRNYYTDKTKAIVGEVYAKDIELFEYSF